MKGLVFNIQRFSVNDGPGIRTTVFLKGCPMHCPWCHNPESISPDRQIVLRGERCLRCGDCYAICKNHAIRKQDGEYVTQRAVCKECGECVEVCVAEAREIVGREMTTEDVIREIEKDRIFFEQSGGGASFSGGEPFLQHEFLLSLVKACKERGIHTVVDTAGYTSPDVLQRISQFVDLFLYDLKTMDNTQHQEFTGVSNRIILENLQHLAEWGHKVIVRIPVIPGVNEDSESVRRIGSFVGALGNVEEIHLLPYHQTGIEKYRRLGMDYRMNGTSVPTQGDLDRLVGELKGHVAAVSIGG
ncbi:MAG: glycyl-radical enzyme activating protein [Ignavibacteria bacterium]|nr:glycyl-radical enzyme activating protein [Ignavibacteria bacterium]